MPLELGPISQQVDRMAASFVADEHRDLLRQARELLRAVDAKELRAKVRDRREKYPWLVAIPVHTLSDTFAPPLPPADFSVIASDGSSIPPDRHSPLRYYVINTGHAVLTYGRHPNADLDSEGRLYFEDDDLYLSPGQKNIPIEGARLGVKMQIAELQAALKAIQAATDPTVVLMDGSLILWPLQSEEKDVKSEFLDQFLKYLDGFRAASVPVAGYISYTGSHDVANVLRVSLCRDDPSDCEHCSLAGEQRALCNFLSTALDRRLFEGLLEEGRRSDVFESTSEILKQYESHRIQFLYLNVGGEVVRIEAPQWVMRDEKMLHLVHALVYDQCQRSPDYPPFPPALQEAHEQAVITAAEGRLMEELVERALAERGIVYARSAKDRSKRRRGV
ncbi:MAG: DNA double-strand break repair nuclease NurA [Anaerolineales bacterium]|nr:DNA double-strand break repair nuclease NurA [Anaerolineales bacterium]